MRSGSLPCSIICAPGAKWMRQPLGRGFGAATGRRRGRLRRGRDARVGAAPALVGLFTMAWSSACSPAASAGSAGCLRWVAVKHLAQHVDRAQQHIDDVRLYLALAAAQLVEQCLERVRKRCDIGEAEGGAATLDGMRHAKNGVDQLGVGFAGTELEQCRLHRAERFEALLEEGLVKLREIECHGLVASAAPGLSSSAPTPSCAIACSSTGERPVQTYSRPRSRQSSANATQQLHAGRIDATDRTAIDFVGPGSLELLRAYEL